MSRLLPMLLLALVVTAGCDSSDDSDAGGEDVTLDAAYLADGAWTFDSVVDDAEITDRIDALLDDYTLDFDADGGVILDVDVSSSVRDEDTRDILSETTYTLDGSALRFGFGEAFTVATVSRDRMDLTGNGLQLLGLLGLDLELDLNSGSALRLRRR